MQFYTIFYKPDNPWHTFDNKSWTALQIIQRHIWKNDLNIYIHMPVTKFMTFDIKIDLKYDQSSHERACQN